MRSFFLFLSLMATSLLAKERVQVVTLTTNLDQPVIIPNIRMALGGAIDGHEEGDTETLFSKKNVATMLTAGLKPLSYRLRTELGGEAWHWNPKGTWSDSENQEGYWTSSIELGDPIIKSYGYCLPRRGNTFDEANNDGYSRLDDGNPSTFWKSNPYLTSTYTGEPDSEHPQWVLLDFGKPVTINAVRLHWRDPYAIKVTFQFSQGGDLYFGHHADWHSFPRGGITHGKGGVAFYDLGEAHDWWGRPMKVRYLRILMTASSGTRMPGSHDPRDAMGYALQEVEAGYLEKGCFHDEVHHAPNQQQTMITVSSTDPWHRAVDRDPRTEQPGVDFIGTSELGNRMPILWSVPVLYDTPENGVALVHFLKQRGYLKAHQKIELGEEPDGQHGDPNDFGALYRQVAMGLHAWDLTLGGPSFVSIECQPHDTTYHFDHRRWLQRFLYQLRKHHQEGDFQFLTFEWYPFDELLKAPSELLKEQPARLKKAITQLRQGGIPPNMPLLITEYGYSVFSGEPEVKIEAALLNADIAAQFLLLRGETSYLYGYEPNRLECVWGNSWGNMMMWLQSHGGTSCKPLPTYYATWLLTHAWGETVLGGPCQIYPVTIDAKKEALTAYLLHQQLSDRWSLLVINKNLTKSYDLCCCFLKHGKEVTPPWGNTLEGYSYSSAQYQWQAKGMQGTPVRNEPPHYQQRTIQGRAPQLDFHVEPCSITVLRDSKRWY